jgi:hypothetical protein
MKTDDGSIRGRKTDKRTGRLFRLLNLPFSPSENLGNDRVNDACFRQVFGLTGMLLDPYQSSLPGGSRQCLMTTFVPAYRCGAVPDSHRIPSCRAAQGRRAAHRKRLQYNVGSLWSQYYRMWRLLALFAWICVLAIVFPRLLAEAEKHK